MQDPTFAPSAYLRIVGDRLFVVNVFVRRNSERGQDNAGRSAALPHTVGKSRTRLHENLLKPAVLDRVHKLVPTERVHVGRRMHLKRMRLAFFPVLN